MPAAAQSHAVSPSRHRCTEVVRAIEATGIHLATAGDLCALRIFSRDGITVVRMPLRAFVENARAPLDGNGHPVPTLHELKARTGISILEQDAAATVAKGDPDRAPNHRSREMSPEQLAKYRAALDDYLSGLCHTKKAAVLKHGIPSYQAFMSWTHKPAQLDLAATFRRPVEKPSGGIL